MTNNKLQIKPKKQITNSKIGAWNLFGACNLRFGAYRNSHGQAGVTLLIAILILSGLALISSAIAVFTIQEVRSSRATLATEPAIVAAEGAGERGVYALKRSNS